MADLKVGDLVVCIEKYEGLPAGKVGVITEADGNIIGAVWGDFNDGHSEVSGADSDNGYNVSIQNLLKINRKPKKKELMLIKKSPTERIYIKESGINFILKFEKLECWVFSCDFRMSRSVILGVESILRGLDSCRD